MHDGLEVEDVNVLSMTLSDGSIFTLDGSWDRPDDGLIEDFVDAAENDRPPLVSGEDGLRETAVVVAVYESDERGEPVATDLEY